MRKLNLSGLLRSNSFGIEYSILEYSLIPNDTVLYCVVTMFYSAPKALGECIMSQLIKVTIPLLRGQQLVICEELLPEQRNTVTTKATLTV